MPRLLHESIARPVTLTAAVLAAACAHASRQTAPAVGAPGPGSPASYSAEVREGYARARAATARFTNLDSAVAAGYPRTVARCIVDEHHGAMGYHHLNRSHIDNRVDVERPEFLIYERKPDSSYVLNGVEYMIPFTRWPADSIAPTLLGQTLLQEPTYRYWYIHMWIWSDNPSGLFADWNPSVKCPPAA